MSEDKHPMVVSEEKTGFLAEIVQQARLAWRLFLDPRVPWWTKLIPPAAIAYVISPVDIMPDVALGLGQLDDIAIILIGVKLFIELCPPNVVREHLAELGAKIKTWQVLQEEKKAEPPALIEGEYEIRDENLTP